MSSGCKEKEEKNIFCGKKSDGYIVENNKL